MKKFLHRSRWTRADYYALGMTILFLVLWVFDLDSLHMKRIMECFK